MTMNFTHPLSKYGLALVLYKENLENEKAILPEHLIKHLKRGLNHFRIYTSNNFKIDEKIAYEYIPLEKIVNDNIKGDPKKGIFLSPSIITSDFQASKCLAANLELIKKLSKLQTHEKLLSTNEKLTQGLCPVAGKFNNGSNSQSSPQASILEVACSAIATITPFKPSRLLEGKNPIALIPDLSIQDMKLFIQFFELMSDSENNNLLKYKKGKNDKNLKRPPIKNGNFPDAPQNDFFGAIGLLASIGKWTNRAGNMEKGKKVLESLTQVPIYTISYGDAHSDSFSHYIIELAQIGKLTEIINAITFKCEIYAVGKRNYADKNNVARYELFDMQASRFLQLFDYNTFKNFLSIRAEYPSELNNLFKIFFEKFMKIDPKIVSSARELGLWLNRVAYFTAKKEAKSPDKIVDMKAKILVELESSAFSAKSGTALIAQTVTRAGRMSGQDAPAEATIFMAATAAGEISLEEAKNLLTAFSRIRNGQESKEKALQIMEPFENEEPIENESVSDDASE